MTRDEARERLSDKHYFQERRGLLLVKDSELIALCRAAQPRLEPASQLAPRPISAS